MGESPRVCEFNDGDITPRHYSRSSLVISSQVNCNLDFLKYPTRLFDGRVLGYFIPGLDRSFDEGDDSFAVGLYDNAEIEV